MYVKVLYPWIAVMSIFTLCIVYAEWEEIRYGKKLKPRLKITRDILEESQEDSYTTEGYTHVANAAGTTDTLDSNLSNYELNRRLMPKHKTHMKQFIEQRQFSVDVPRQEDFVAAGKRFSLTIDNDQIDNFQVKLPTTLANYKNPCWYEIIPESHSCNNSYYGSCLFDSRHPGNRKPRMVTYCHTVDQLFRERKEAGENWRLRCIPYFFVLGVTKSGTTDLFATLRDHVSDLLPGALKEPHFWEAKRHSRRKKCEVEPMVKFSTYLDVFDLAAEFIRTQGLHKKGTTIYHPSIIGDFSPSTLTRHFDWQNRPGNAGRMIPRYTSAHYMYHILPSAKLIIIMRDPVERLYSNYRMRLRAIGINNTSSFDREAIKAVHDFQRCEAKYSSHICAYHSRHLDILHMLIRGLYEIFIRDWMLVYPKHQFLFITNEEYREHREETIEKVVHFLGTAPLSTASRAKLKEEENIIKLISRHQIGYTDMQPATRQLLRDFYRPHNRRLTELLEDDKYMWNY